MAKPPNSVQLFSYKDISSAPPSEIVQGPATVIVEQFTAYIGAPDALLRNAIVIVDLSSPTPGGTIWEAHVDVGAGGFPIYVTTNGRWIFTVPNPDGEWCLVAPTTGEWDVAAFGFVLEGVNPNWPLQS